MLEHYFVKPSWICGKLTAGAVPAATSFRKRRFSSTTAPQAGLLLRHNKNVGISKAVVNGLVPI